MSEISNALARARSEQAAERTLMAWTRTALAAIGFGFGIEKVIGYIKKVDPERPVEFNDPDRLFGAYFVCLGTFTLLAAALQHWQTLKKIRQEKVIYSQPWPLAEVVAMAVVVIGLFGLHAMFT